MPGEKSKEFLLKIPGVRKVSEVVSRYNTKADREAEESQARFKESFKAEVKQKVLKVIADNLGVSEESIEAQKSLAEFFPGEDKNQKIQALEQSINKKFKYFFVLKPSHTVEEIIESIFRIEFEINEKLQWSAFRNS